MISTMVKAKGMSLTNSQSSSVSMREVKIRAGRLNFITTAFKRFASLFPKTPLLRATNPISTMIAMDRSSLNKCVSPSYKVPVMIRCPLPFLLPPRVVILFSNGETALGHPRDG
jgi:hypothetical protein